VFASLGVSSLIFGVIVYGSSVSLSIPMDNVFFFDVCCLMDFIVVLSLFGRTSSFGLGHFVIPFCVMLLDWLHCQRSRSLYKHYQRVSLSSSPIET
jgi:hypothetical protein